ncbi:MAG: DUF305 domain-containing protein [Acidimicrobiia bacterium]
MGDEPEDDAGWETAWPLGLWRTVTLIAAIAFLVGVIGWRIGRPDRGSFNEVDAGFLADMSTHHEGALALGFAYLPRQHDAVVSHFAREIIRDQSVEINAMTVLLGDAGDVADAVLDDDIAMDWMDQPSDPLTMPGMATAAAFDELDAASGNDADELFTQLMIEHHAAGVEMADFEAKHGENETVRALARAMARVQRIEIREMNRRRLALGLERVDTDAGSHSEHT